MVTSNKVKQFIQEKCNAEVVGIAPATPFREEDKKRITDTLETMGAANPAMNNPQVFDAENFIDGAKAVIVFGRNSYFGAGPCSGNDRSEVPRGAIGNFYLNHNILNNAVLHTSLVTGFLESNGCKAVSTFTGFAQKIKAMEAGIGVWGKNTLIINKRLGSWISLSTIITDAPLEPDEPLKGDCGACKLCVEACPMGALSNPYNVKVEQCIIYYLCHLKSEIPVDVRDKTGVRIGSCTICSEVCPRNKDLHINTADKLPDEMIYPELIPMMNMDEDEYEKKYASQMFGFIMGGRRYLRRNVAVALGNSGNKKALPCLEIAARGEDPLISSHAAWAIEKIREKK
jgi:epoxyqueuosine reductase